MFRRPSVERAEIKLLRSLLKEERERVRELELRLWGPLPTVAAGDPVGPVAPPRVLAPAKWDAPLLPIDEAQEDLDYLVRTNQMNEAEAGAILEMLGFPNTEVESVNDPD